MTGRQAMGAWLRRWLIKRPAGANLSKLRVALAAVNAVQLAVLAVLIIRILMGERDLPEGWTAAVCLIAMINNIILMHSGRSAEAYRSRLADMEALVRSQDELNRQLRMQRHDFLNHLQVISALIQLGDEAKAMEYMDQVCRDLQRVGRLLRTRSSAVNGLLAAKSVQGEKRGITVAYEITTALDRLPLEDWELCRILSNLLDNAMDAAQSAARPWVELRLWEDAGGIRFRVSNRGAMISPEDLNRIFAPGFTTKGERGTGMGLAIVESIVEGCGGGVQVESGPELTLFEGVLPFGGGSDISDG